MLYSLSCFSSHFLIIYLSFVDLDPLQMLCSDSFLSSRYLTFFSLINLDVLFRRGAVIPFFHLVF